LRRAKVEVEDINHEALPAISVSSFFVDHSRVRDRHGEQSGGWFYRYLARAI
jgi:hypothetical protein